jgi:prophage regulatory protein
MANRLIPLSAVSDARRNQSKAGIYNNIKDGLLPHPVKLGRSSAWVENEIQAINTAIIKGASDDEIRQLVRELEASRTAAGNEETIKGASDADIRTLVIELKAARTEDAEVRQ